jgi:hypothetical protein
LTCPDEVEADLKVYNAGKLVSGVGLMAEFRGFANMHYILIGIVALSATHFAL